MLWSPGLEKPYGALAFAPDGRTLAIAQLDRTILLWDVAAGRRLCELRGHLDQIWALAFSPDGHRLASGGNDMTVHLWDVPSVASH